jgi:hypothetical protein
MELGLASLAISAAFAAGVVFHKYMISEATAIKDHVTAEVAEVRADIASALGNAAKKVG